MNISTDYCKVLEFLICCKEQWTPKHHCIRKAGGFAQISFPPFPPLFLLALLWEPLSVSHICNDPVPLLSHHCLKVPGNSMYYSYVWTQPQHLTGILFFHGRICLASKPAPWSFLAYESLQWSSFSTSRFPHVKWLFSLLARGRVICLSGVKSYNSQINFAFFFVWVCVLQS